MAEDMEGKSREGAYKIGDDVMKVWERIAEINGGQLQLFIEHCPSSIEEHYHLIGEKRFNKHCSIGCGVECTKEYLELEIRSCHE